MKVLFAVSNDNISEAIIKRYPKEYKELLSYKNVYYFNAILKEIQKDKSYDRIVISEDLEPFVNTNHDSIDNFIFENLDKISDEAHDNEGKETAIILICSERRAPGSAILNKFFSIGVYNAIMGNDRNMSELCKLINRPRTKKEAKVYYRIDQATYDPVLDNEVNEVEIQNILAHFRKLGKNTERYADSFNNIAAQYTDEQLKIIINVLPMKVKAVLESESNKYQALMGTGSNGSSKRMRDEEPEPGISVNAIGNGPAVSGPIVIPSNVKKVSDRSFTAPKVNANNMNNLNNQNGNTGNVVKVPRPVVSPQRPNPNMQSAVRQPNAGAQMPNNAMNAQRMQRPMNSNVSQQATVVQNTVRPVNNTVLQQATNVQNTVRSVNNNPQQVTNSPIETEEVNDNMEGEDIIEENTVNEPEVAVKKGRGRPRKLVVDPPKPKGKRGRPRKVLETEPEETVENEDSSLNDLLSSIENEDDGVLPGLEDIPSPSELQSEEASLPGMEDDENVGELPGLDDIDNTEDYNSELDASELPGLEPDDGDGEEVDVSSLLAGLDDDGEDAGELPGLESDEGTLPGLDDTENDDMMTGMNDNDIPEDDVLPRVDDNMMSDYDSNSNYDSSYDSNYEDEEETLLPGMGFQDTTDDGNFQNNTQNVNAVESIKPKVDYSMSNLNSLLSKDKKIVTFIGTTKNGTSFLVNNLALMFSLMGINTAILDMTQNRNSYYIFTDSREELRNIAYTSISKLENGYAEGIRVNKNLSVYTALPADGNKYDNAEPILSTLVQNHSLILIDCDFETDPAYFASCQEIYLVQSMDILTIQPLTAFLRELKFKGAWEPEKVRVVINKETKIRCLNNKMIIAGMSRYNGPDMSVMTDLFNKDMVKACSIPFDEKVYSKYLETMATCKLSLNGYPKPFMSKMQMLGEMVYPRLNSKKSYRPMGNSDSNENNSNVFSNDTNNTLNQMKNRY